MDFCRIKSRVTKTGVEVYPDFKVTRSKDLMIRGKSFYAIWDEEAGLWSTDEYDVQRIVDSELHVFASQMEQQTGVHASVKFLSDFSSNSWRDFRSYVGLLSDSSNQLDEELTFANTVVKKNDYVSRRLPYSLEAGDFSAWDELLSVLYEPEEREKIEWAIGSIIAGDAKLIQKFLVLYGAAGTGKSTILNIIQMLFEGYYTTFEAKALASNNNAFATEAFKSNPLVALQHDGDLSKIEDNSKLNSIISHEDMTINEKFKPSYTSRVNAFLFMGTNKPVKITDAKSGLIRRLIDVKPTGEKLSPRRYQTLMAQIHFELGAIAWHCLQTYRDMGKEFYSSYRPEEMMLQTDIFFNYIESNFGLFKSQDGVSLTQAWELYKNFIEESGVEYKLPKYKLREELRNYFDHFHDRSMVDGVQVRSWYSGFRIDRFKVKKKEPEVLSLVMDQSKSILDDELSDMYAQYATIHETPIKPWADVTSKLEELDTSRLHYVMVPDNHIVIDFDLIGADGEKSAELNLEAASLWPATYAEYSKSGSGIHLHYNYDGDPTQLERIYSEGIEVKVFVGKSSLRRMLTACNAVPISTINSGLPIKEKKHNMLNGDAIKSEKGLRDLIERNLRKEIHPGTKSSVDFIHKILEDAYNNGVVYDVTNLRGRILSFATQSTNQALTAIKTVQTMKFASEVESAPTIDHDTSTLAVFDCEVYPNLFVICWKYRGSDTIVKMVNPTPQQVEELLILKLIGFNCRRYDNHILYARIMGFSNEQLYQLSQKLIGNDRAGYFREAYNLSYADIYDYSSKKQSLKKFQIELGITHLESEIPWDEPVKDSDIPKVVEYCCNDVEATEAVLNARQADLDARLILASLSGLSVNDTTQKHTAKIVFGDDRNAQDEFVYTDLSEMFPGYKYDFGKSHYKGELVGEGGYVYAEPGLYENVALLDVESMHPTSIEQLDAFGPYTKNFSALKNARMAIKHGEYDFAKTLLGGKLAPFLDDPEQAEALSYALKIVINIVYGLTSAKFDNPFRDKRNKDNIVAKRGALFMIDLKEFVQSQGFTVAHIKTDSIKIPNATPEIIDMVMEFGKNYGYDFEHEATYEKFCLVNDAVYIARVAAGRKPAHWSAVGAQFAHPYVYKTLFTHEEIIFDDLCETKQVSKGAIYIDRGAVDRAMHEPQDRIFVGRVGRFTPVVDGAGGGVLLRVTDDKSYSVTGTKDFLWKESEILKSNDQLGDIDYSYFEGLAYKAKETINKFGAFEDLMDVKE